MKDLVAKAAAFLNSAGIAVKDLDDRQGLLGLGKLEAQTERRRQRHHGVEADVVFAAECPGVGQRRCRNEASQLRSALQFVNHDRHDTRG